MSLRSTVFLGFPDHISKSYTTISSTGTVPATLPLTNLQTDEPSEITRITSLDPTKTQIGFYFAGTEVDIDGFALVNHNMTAGNQYRFVGFSNNTTSWTYQQLAPNAIAGSTNVSGVVGNIDETIDAPDGLVIEPSTKTSPMVLRLGFPTPGSTPDSSTPYGAAFVIRAQLKFVGAGATSPTTLPTIQVELREQGSPASQALGSRVIQVSAAGGQVLVFPFSFAQLAAPSGVNLEVEVTLVPGTSASGSSYGAIETLRVIYDNDITALSGYLSSTPWLNVIGYDEDIGNNTHDHYFPVKPTRVENGLVVPDYDTGDLGTWTGIKSLVLLIRTDQTAPTVKRTIIAPLVTYEIRDPIYVSTDGSVPYAGLSTPDTWLDLGVVEAGVAKFLTFGILPPGPLTSPHSEQFAESSISGQSYSVDSFQQSVSEPMTLQVTRGEAQWIQKEVGRKKGLSNPFYVAMEPDLDAELQEMTSGWMTLADDLGAPRKIGAYTTDETMMMEIVIRLKEKL